MYFFLTQRTSQRIIHSSHLSISQILSPVENTVSYANYHVIFLNVIENQSCFSLRLLITNTSLILSVASTIISQLKRKHESLLQQLGWCCMDPNNGYQFLSIPPIFTRFILFLCFFHRSLILLWGMPSGHKGNLAWVKSTCNSYISV